MDSKTSEAMNNFPFYLFAGL